jgi:hypothetical protein
LTLVWGGIAGYDQATFLNSLAAESVFLDRSNQLWSRTEVLQRTPAELAIANAQLNVGQWVSAVTFGYTRRLVSLWRIDLSLGGAVTGDILPPAFAHAYGGTMAFTGRLFVEARMMEMFATP